MSPSDPLFGPGSVPVCLDRDEPRQRRSKHSNQTEQKGKEQRWT